MSGSQEIEDGFYFKGPILKQVCMGCDSRLQRDGWRGSWIGVGEMLWGLSNRWCVLGGD